MLPSSSPIGSMLPRPLPLPLMTPAVPGKHHTTSTTPVIPGKHHTTPMSHHTSFPVRPNTTNPLKQISSQFSTDLELRITAPLQRCSFSIYSPCPPLQCSKAADEPYFFTLLRSPPFSFLWNQTTQNALASRRALSWLLLRHPRPPTSFHEASTRRSC